ncbi:transcriptional protein SWT1-like isoform X1 [Daktulosphaira vitifoliae]|uniref:transcriptional protein SWT1-like isoform X1 n=1 Tax=Daktulosphaira vitifoliae TaxID=58002 RepID=UPI0021A99FD9|nr:transcriptional protein SWT1-like isoform X1 [Daktulosphaira vitifoliae]
MDNCKNKLQQFSPNNYSPFSIEFGDDSLGKTLDERIQAAKEAASNGKLNQKHNSNNKFMMYNKVMYNNDSLETKKKLEQHSKTKNEQVPQSFDFTNYSNLHVKLNSVITSKISARENGIMQRRLEAVKAKKLSNIFSSEYDNIADLSINSHTSKYPSSINQSSIKFKNVIKNNTSTSFVPKELSTKVFVEKISSKQDLCSIKNKHCNRIKQSCAIPASSVQNRLTKARNEIYAKSKQQTSLTETKFLSKLNASKIKTIDYSATTTSTENKQKDNSVHTMNKNKRKRLNDTPQIPLYSKIKPNSIISNVKKTNSYKHNISNTIDKQFINIQEKTAQCVNTQIPKKLETCVSKLPLNKSESISKTPQNESNNFSFNVLGQFSAQQRLENIRKGLNPRLKNSKLCSGSTSFQQNNIESDDGMEWEDIETDNIIETVNDLRKTTQNFEPMECTPDSIMHSDKINCCLVIDTNILLSNLKSCMDIIDYYSIEFGYITIVLPWQVLHELDRLKTNDNALGYRAREATRWLLEMLSKNHPQLKGQPMTNKKDVTADDAILKCALIIRDRVNVVFLITDDKILSVKSEINGICVKNSIWLQNMVKAKEPNSSKVFQAVAMMFPKVEDSLLVKLGPHLENTFARVLKLAASNYTVHSNSVTKSWWKVFSLNPPLSLTQIISKLNTNWYIVAPKNLYNFPKFQLVWLEEFIKDTSQLSTNMTDSSTVYNFLKYCAEIINALPYEYFNITDVLLNDLMVARKILKQKIIGSLTEEESLSLSLSKLEVSKEKMNVENIFDEILLGIDRYCSHVYQANGLARSSMEKSKDNINSLFPLKLILDSQINDFRYKVTSIVEIMLKIHDLDSESILNGNDTIDEFYKSIVEFNKNFCKLSKESIVDFCLMKEKNSFIYVLVSFQNHLSSINNILNSKLCKENVYENK